MAPLVGLIVFLGVYPKPMLDRIEPSVDRLVAHIEANSDYVQPEVATTGAGDAADGADAATRRPTRRRHREPAPGRPRPTGRPGPGPDRRRRRRLGGAGPDARPDRWGAPAARWPTRSRRASRCERSTRSSPRSPPARPSRSRSRCGTGCRTPTRGPSPRWARRVGVDGFSRVRHRHHRGGGDPRRAARRRLPPARGPRGRRALRAHAAVGVRRRDDGVGQRPDRDVPRPRDPVDRRLRAGRHAPAADHRRRKPA